MQGGCRSPSREVRNILRSGLPAEVPKAVFPWKCWRDLSGLRAPRMDLRGNSSVFPRNAVVCLSEEGSRQTLPWFLPECVRMSGKSHVHLDITPAELGIPTSLLLESACCVRSPEGCSLGKRLCPEGAGKRGGGGEKAWVTSKWCTRSCLSCPRRSLFGLFHLHLLSPQRTKIEEVTNLGYTAGISIPIVLIPEFRRTPSSASHLSN